MKQATRGLFGHDRGPDYTKPLPVITPTNRPYWEAARRHEFLLQRCDECASWIYPISVSCQGCGATERYTWTAPSGRARLSSWVVYHRAFPPFEPADLPYAVVEVELQEGMRMVSQTVRLDPARYEPGMELRVAFHDVTPEVSLVVFEEAGIGDALSAESDPGADS